MTVRVLVTIVLALLTSPAQAQLGAVEGTIRGRSVSVAGTVVALVAEAGAARRVAPDTVVIDQRDLRFVPFVIVVPPGAAVRFLNSDPVFHNVFSPPGPGDGFDLGVYPPPQYRLRTFTQLGAHVILCHVHPEMVAYVVVVPTAYAAVAGSGGSFRIDDVPPGRYVVRVWHRAGRSPNSVVSVGPGQVVHLELRLDRR